MSGENKLWQHCSYLLGFRGAGERKLIGGQDAKHINLVHLRRGGGKEGRGV